MNKAVISGDIIAFTSLRNSDKQKIESEISGLLRELKKKYNVYGRIIKGDYLECLIPKPQDSLRIALAIRSRIKYSGKMVHSNGNMKTKLFKTYGIRLAIGIGKMSRIDIRKGIIDGEAIYFSGRLINESINTSDKRKVTIKQTLFIKTNNEELNFFLEPVIMLIDALLQKSTAKQNHILYLKLMGLDEEKISKKLHLTQSTINQHSTAVGWNSIESALEFFEKLTFKN